MPSDTILPVVESRSTQPSNRCIPTELETSGSTICFSLFFNDRESSIKGQNRGVGCNSNNTKLATKTLVQSGSRIICNRTSASNREPKPITRSLESFRQNWSRKEFQQGLKSLSQVLKDQAHHVITNRPSVNGLAGVVNRKLIRIHAI